MSWCLDINIMTLVVDLDLHIIKMVVYFSVMVGSRVRFPLGTDMSHCAIKIVIRHSRLPAGNALWVCQNFFFFFYSSAAKVSG